LTHIQAGRLELHPAPCLVAEAVDAALSENAAAASQKELTVTSQVDRLMQVVFDARSLRHIVHNLVNNAVKFTSHHGSVTISAMESPTGTVVEVRDTGIGIKPEDQPRLFEEFRQVDGSTSRGYEGIGLGLALSKRLVELQGGQIWVESIPGRGSAFRFLIPRRPLVAAQERTGRAPLRMAGVHVDADEGKQALAAGADRFLTDLGPLSTGSGRELGADQDLVQAVRGLLGAEPEQEVRPVLLAIDDDPDNRAFLTKAVQKQGFDVVTAPNATQARRQLDGRRPALIFLDVQMPEESGLSLLPQMLRDFPESVVVMMTAYGSEQVAAEALRGGADDYIAKPIDLHRLRELLERNLEKQRRRAERLGLVNDILELAKIEAGKMDLHPEEMPVMEALQEITAILDPMARQQGLHLRTVGAADAGVIKADRSKFKQVLYNLLSNAVKFTPAPGTITVSVKD